MFRALVFASFTLATTGFAAAQERSAPIFEMLDRLPMPAGENVVEIDYGNPGPVRGAALMAAALGQMEDDPVLAPVLRTVPTFLGQRAVPLMDSLPETHGIDLLQVARFAMMTQLPLRAALLELPDGTGDGVVAAISGAGMGYEETHFHGQSVLWRGEDFDMDLEQRGEFFGYGLGQSSRIWIDGDLLVQTASWPAMAQAMAAPEGAVGGEASVAALLSSLDGALPAPGQVAALRLYLNLPETFPGRAILVADMLHGAREGAIFAVATQTPAEAERLATAARDNWDSAASEMTRRTMAESFAGDMQATMLDIDGVPLMAITVYGPRSGESPFWRNDAYVRFNSRLMAGDWSWLAP